MTKLIVGEKVETADRADSTEKLIKLLADDYIVSWTPEMQTPTELKKFNSSKPAVLQSTKKSDLTPGNLVKEKQLIEKEHLEKQSNVYGVNKAKSAVSNTVKSDYLSKDYIEKTNNSINEYNRSVIQNVCYNNTVVEYENALGEGIDIKYTITSYSVKEDVIVEEPGTFDSYSVSVDSKTLIPQLNEDGSIEFYDEEGTVRMSINAPLMYDANNSISTDILVEIENKDDEYVITYTPSQEWLNSIEREYPVVIDPEYGGGQHVYNSTAMLQTFVCSNYPDNTYNNYRFMYVSSGNFIESNTTRDYGVGEGWFRFTRLPDFSGKIIRSSYIDFTLDAEKNGNTRIDAYIPSTPYNYSATWESKPEMEHCIESNIVQTLSGSKYHYYITLGTLPIQWGHVDARAFGIYLKPSSGSTGYSLLLSSNSTVNPPVYVYSYDLVNSGSNVTEVNIPSGYYYIKSAEYQDMYLSVNTDTNEVVIANEVSGLTEKWYIKNHGNNTYSFTPLTSHRCRMEVHCAEYADYRPMTIYNYTDYGDLSSNAIRYKIIEESSGKYSIRPVSKTNYALTLYNEGNCTMYFYNRYTEQYRAFAKRYYQSCQLNKYNREDGQKWEFVSTGYYCYINDKPTVVKDGITYNIMTTTDYQYIKAVSNESTNGCYWASTNPSVATIQGSGNTARITPVGAGTTTITLTNRFGIQCDSFTLIVCDPSNPDNDQNTAELCELRGYWLEVPLMPQTQNNTCGSACVAMILKYFDYKENGAYLTDQQIYNYILSQNKDPEILGNLTDMLNSKLDNVTYNNFLGEPNFQEKMRNSIIAGRPVIALIKLFSKDQYGNDLDNPPFYYHTDGHFVLVTGIYKDSNGVYQVVINDPFSASWTEASHIGQIVGPMPVTTLQVYMDNHGARYMIY